MLSARVSLMSEWPLQVRGSYRPLAFGRPIARARDTVYTEGNVKKAFESTGIHPVNPRTVLGNPKPGESQNITRPMVGLNCCMYAHVIPSCPIGSVALEHRACIGHQ